MCICKENEAINLNKNNIIYLKNIFIHSREYDKLFIITLILIIINTF